MRKFWVLLIFLLFPSLSWAWGEMGHAVIAVIAYQRLTPQAKMAIDNLTQIKFHSTYPENRFYEAAIWPDIIEEDAAISAFAEWHFIAAPYVFDFKTPRPISNENVVWAIQQSYKVVSNPRPYPEEKVWFLSFLVHFVGDVHQPLHCITRYSNEFPRGDAGGNAVMIQGQDAKNLHQYWDWGGGIFTEGYRLNYRVIEDMAAKITKAYPESYFGNRVKNLDPDAWARESFELGKLAYDGVQNNGTLSAAYIQRSQIIIAQQLALAGYRLANMLNTAFAQIQTQQPPPTESQSQNQYHTMGIK